MTVVDSRNNKTYELPITTGIEPFINANDLAKIVDDEKKVTRSYDPGFLNTISCTSKISFIDGDVGILEYRGYPIEQLAEHSNYLEVSYLLIYGELPTKS